MERIKENTNHDHYFGEEETILNNQRSSTKRNGTGRPGERSRAMGELDLVDLVIGAKDTTKKNKKFLSNGLKMLGIHAKRVFDVRKSEENHLRFICEKDQFHVPMSVEHLKELDLSQNILSEFLSVDIIKSIRHIKILSLNDNKISTISVDSIHALAAHGTLEELNLSSNCLEQLPTEINCLMSLKRLKLNHNRLIELPKTITDLVHLYDPPDAFSIKANRLVNPQQIIAEKGGLLWIKLHFQMLEDKSSVDLMSRNFFALVAEQFPSKDVNNSTRDRSASHPTAAATKSGGKGDKRSFQLKLLVIGHQGAGKTSLIRKLNAATSKSTDSASNNIPIPPPVNNSTTIAAINSCSSSVSGEHTPPRFGEHLTLLPPAPAMTPLSGAGAAVLTPHSTRSGRNNSGFTTPGSEKHGNNQRNFFSPGPTAGDRSNSPVPGAPTTTPARAQTLRADQVNESSSSDSEDLSTVGCNISIWHPKKKDVNALLFPAPDKKHEKSSKSLLQMEPDDIEFTVFDFAGQGVYHAVHEMFFSQFALHLIAFDVSRVKSSHDCDIYVQYWIDLIQARAPGSSVILVATHSDHLTNTDVNNRIEKIQARIISNELLRLDDLKRDIEYCTDIERQGVLRRLLQTRPQICPFIAALGNMNDSKKVSWETMVLIARIVTLSSPTPQNKHPFGIIDTPVGNFYYTVRKCMKDLHDTGKKFFCTLQEVEEAVAREQLSGSTHSNPAAMTTAMVKNRILMAVEYWSSVGKILLFHSNKPLPKEESIGDAIPKPATDCTNTAVGTNVTTYIFLDQVWLVNCIKLILDHNLLAEIARFERLDINNDEESKRAANKFLASKLSAKRGIIEWQFIRKYLTMRQEMCDHIDEIEVIRLVLESFNIIVPITTPTIDTNETASSTVATTPYARSMSNNVVPSTVSVTGTVVAANRTQSAGPTLGSTTNAGAIPTGEANGPGMLNMYQRNSNTNLSNLSKRFSGQNLSALAINPPTDMGNQFYLIPALLPAYHNEVPNGLSGFVTLERTFHFNRFTPPGLIQTLFSRIYSIQKSHPLTSVESNSQNLCWDRAFVQEHKPVKVLVELVPRQTNSVDESFCVDCSSEGENPAPVGRVTGNDCNLDYSGFSSQLRIKGIGHMLNSHHILEQLDKYTALTKQVLDDYPGLGHVRLSATCPICLMNQLDDNQRGEFRYSELVALQETFKELNKSLSSALLQMKHGTISTKLNSDLLKWSRPRICPLKQCQIRSDMLIHIPMELKNAIEQTSKSEKEIRFLLDEVVRSSSVPSKQIAKGVLKIMAAKCLRNSAQDIYKFFDEKTMCSSPLYNRIMEDDQAKLDLPLIPVGYSSGVLVVVPPRRSAPNSRADFQVQSDEEPELMVLACEHVITDIKEGGAVNVFSSKIQDVNAEAIFLVGDKTHWLYLAQMVFQGSQHPCSETKFWDICALKVLAPIVPLDQTCEGDIPIVQIYLNELLSMPQSGESKNNGPPTVSTSEFDSTPTFMHPHFLPESSPLSSVAMSTRKVAVDQVVRVLGYPGRKALGSLGVDWGRVELNNPQGDILVNLLSDNGSSGGPVVDRDGELIGVLSRSHQSIRYSCVQPVRNLFDLIQK